MKKRFRSNSKLKVPFWILIGTGLIITLFTFSLKLSPPVKALFLDLYALEDAYADANNPSNNYGSSTILVASYSLYDARDRRSFLKFNLSQVPTGFTIDAAELCLYYYRDPPSGWDPGNLYIWKIANQTWLEENVTWNDQPSMDNFPNGNNWLEQKAYPSTPAWSNFSSAKLLSYVQDEYSKANANVSFGLKGNETGGSSLNWYLYAQSKENGTAYQTHLRLEYSNPPAPDSIGETSHLANTSCTFHANWTAVSGTMDSYIFGWNGTGAFQNESAQNFYGEKIISECPTGSYYMDIQTVHPSDTNALYSSIGHALHISAPSSESYNVSGVEFRLRSVGNPNCNITAAIYEVSGIPGRKVPINVWSKIENSTTILNSTTLTSSFAWYRFNFSNNTMIPDGSEEYGVSVYAIDNITLDGTNHFHVQLASANPYANGNTFRYDYPAWGFMVNIDTPHKLYGVRGFKTWTNITLTLPSEIVGDVIAWEIWANNTAGFWNTTGLQYFQLTGVNLTFYHSADGFFQVNGVNRPNASNYGFANGTNLELLAACLNASYLWQNFSWDTGSALTNRHNITITLSLEGYDFWAYFSWITPPPLAEYLIDSFNYSAPDSDIEYSLPRYWPDDPVNGRASVGQTFTASRDYIVTKAVFWIRKPDAAYNATFAALLFEMEGTLGINGKPTGEVLAISEYVVYDSLGTGVHETEFTFNASQQYAIAAGNWCIAIANIIDPDGNPYVKGEWQYVYGPDDGNFFQYYAGPDYGNWYAGYPERETYFQIYGVPTTITNIVPYIVSSLIIMGSVCMLGLYNVRRRKH